MNEVAKKLILETNLKPRNIVNQIDGILGDYNLPSNPSLKRRLCENIQLQLSQDNNKKQST